MTQTSRQDVIDAAGRLFAKRGYHGTSMRTLGKELGLVGSSLYSHVGSKEELLVEVVRHGAALFEASVDRARAGGGDGATQLRNLITGHLDVVLDNRDAASTYLNEASVLDADHRNQVRAERNRYEQAFREVFDLGTKDGSLPKAADPKLAAIFTLSVLNAVPRWYRPLGPLDRTDLADEIFSFVTR